MKSTRALQSFLRDLLLWQVSTWTKRAKSSKERLPKSQKSTDRKLADKVNDTSHEKGRVTWRIKSRPQRYSWEAWTILPRYWNLIKVTANICPGRFQNCYRPLTPLWLPFMDGNAYSYHLLLVTPLYIACTEDGEITSFFSFTDQHNFKGTTPKEPHPNIDII